MPGDLRGLVEPAETLPEAFQRNSPAMPGWNEAEYNKLHPRLKGLVREIGQYERGMPGSARGIGNIGRLSSQDLMELDAAVRHVL